MTTATDHLQAGDKFEIPVPGTGMREWQPVEIVALPGDPGFFCGGDPEPEKYVVAKINGRTASAVHARYFAPEFIR